NVIPTSSEHLTYVRPISYQTSRLWKFPKQANEGEPFRYGYLADLLRSDEHEGGRQQDTSINVFHPGSLQGTLEIIRDLHLYNFSFDPDRPYRRLRRVELRCVKAGDAKDRYPGESGNDLLEQPQLLPAQFRKIKECPRHIAARACKTFDISFGKRIALQIQRDNGNGARCILGRRARLWSWREKDVHVVPNKIGRKLGQSLRVEVAKAIFDRDIFALDVARFGQTPLERGDQMRDVLSRRGVQKSDHRHRRLLRARCERPCCRADTRRQELTPFHWLS